MAQVDQTVDGNELLSQLVQWRLEHSSDHDLRQAVDGFLLAITETSQFQSFLNDEFSSAEVQSLVQTMVQEVADKKLARNLQPKLAGTAPTTTQQSPGHFNAEQILTDAPELPDEDEEEAGWRFNPLSILFRIDDLIRGATLDYVSIPRLALFGLVLWVGGLAFYYQPAIFKRFTESELPVAGQDSGSTSSNTASTEPPTANGLRALNTAPTYAGASVPTEEPARTDSGADRVMLKPAETASGIDITSPYDIESSGGEVSESETTQPTPISITQSELDDREPSRSETPVENNLSFDTQFAAAEMKELEGVEPFSLGEDEDVDSRLRQFVQVEDWGGGVNYLERNPPQNGMDQQMLQLLFEAEELMRQERTNEYASLVLRLAEQGDSSLGQLRDMTIARLLWSIDKTTLPGLTSQMLKSETPRRYHTWVTCVLRRAQDADRAYLKQLIAENTTTSFCDLIFLASTRYSDKVQIRAALQESQRKLQAYALHELDDLDDLSQSMARVSVEELGQGLQYFITRLSDAEKSDASK